MPGQSAWGYIFRCWAVGASGRPLRQTDEDMEFAGLLLQRSRYLSLSGLSSHSSASGGPGFFSVRTGHFLASSALIAVNFFCSSGRSSSAKMAFTGHSGTHRVQSMHSSGSMTRKLGPSWKQSTGQTSTQSVSLQRMQLSVTTYVIDISVTHYFKTRRMIHA